MEKLMPMVTIAAVVIAACLSQVDAQTISCYNTAGGIETNCAFCQKTVIGAPGISIIQSSTTKACVSSCISANAAGVGNFCCQANLCNGATFVHFNFVTALVTIVFALWMMRK